MHVYHMDNKELAEVYSLALKGQKYNLSLDDEMILLETFNESFEQNHDSIIRHDINNLIDFMREEIADRFVENVSYMR